MSKILLVILVVTGLFVLVRSLERLAQKNLEGKSLPEGIDLEQSSPDGVVFYFYHPKCGPCKRMSPVVDELKQQFSERVVKVNIVDRQDLAQAFGIRVTPTTVMVKNNNITRAIIGFTSPKNLTSLFNSG